MRQSKKIAVASISSAIAIILSIVSHYWGFATLSMGLMASMATALPMIVYDSIKSSLLSFIVTSIILIIVINVYSLGYILFFGLYPFIFRLSLRMPNKALRYILKVIYFALLLIVVYFIASNFIEIPAIDRIKENSLFALYLIIGLAFSLIYDYLWSLLYKVLKSRFRALDV